MSNPWSVEWSKDDQVEEHKASGKPNVFLASNGRDEAFREAKKYLGLGYTVWSISHGFGNVVMDQDAVWRHFNDRAGGTITSGG